MSEPFRFLSDQSKGDLAPRYTYYVYDGIRFSESMYPKDSWVRYVYTEAVPYNSTRVCQIQVSGTMTEPTGTWADRHGDWVSREHDNFTLPVGTWQWDAASDVELWCCLGRWQGEDLGYITPIRLKKNVTFPLLQDENLFMVKGSVRVEGGGKNYSGIQRLKCSTGFKEVTTIEDGYAFRWVTPTT